jgi:hypothetical protein
MVPAVSGMSCSSSLIQYMTASKTPVIGRYSSSDLPKDFDDPSWLA